MVVVVGRGIGQGHGGGRLGWGSWGGVGTGMVGAVGMLQAGRSPLPNDPDGGEMEAFFLPSHTPLPSGTVHQSAKGQAGVWQAQGKGSVPLPLPQLPSCSRLQHTGGEWHGKSRREGLQEGMQAMQWSTVPVPTGAQGWQ